MIRSLANLLAQLRASEARALAAFPGPSHAPTIGAMYEGLTHSLLEKALFDGCDLRVVSGHVRLPTGHLSKQIDAMVVFGTGEAIPHTEAFIYELSQVLCVIEVTKTLFGPKLADALGNLRSIIPAAGMKTVPRRRFEIAYRAIVQQPLPTSLTPDGLPPFARLAWDALQRDAVLPVRIVLGYSGYATELGLREGLLGVLRKAIGNGPTVGFGPVGLPNLIISGNNALVKLNGLPYARVEASEAWRLYASAAGISDLLLLEVLWTRIASEFGLPSAIFGEDLESEVLHPLLTATVTERNGRRGWSFVYNHIGEEELVAIPPQGDWAPIHLSDEQATMMACLIQEGTIDTKSSKVFQEFVKQEPSPVGVFLDDLRRAGIAALDAEGRLQLLTDECGLACLPNGQFVAAENLTGRLTRWLVQQMKHDNPSAE